MISLIERPAGHYYSSKKTLYPSVTTILSSVPNPGLNEWKLKTPNWRQISAAACKTGTEVHTEIEHMVLGKHPVVKHKMQMRAFLKWQSETGFNCMKTEVKVRSSKGYAGSLDLLGKIENELIIIDLKTSKKLYPEMLLQLSAYKYAFLEKNTLLDVNIGVLRIDKKELNDEGNVAKIEWVFFTEKEYEEGIDSFLKILKKWHKEHKIENEFNKKFVLEE